MKFTQLFAVAAVAGTFATGAMADMSVDDVKDINDKALDAYKTQDLLGAGWTFSTVVQAINKATKCPVVTDTGSPDKIKSFANCTKTAVQGNSTIKSTVLGALNGLCSHNYFVKSCSNTDIRALCGYLACALEPTADASVVKNCLSKGGNGETCANYKLD